jgi:hypothetical protein
MLMRRRGAPLLAAAATTAVVAGTAGAVHHHQQQKYARQEAEHYAAAGQVQMEDQLAAQQAQIEAMQRAQAQGAPAAGGIDLAQLKQLGDLHAAGVLTDEEFAAAKAKLLG